MNVTFYLRKEKKSKKTGLIPVAVLVTDNGLIVRKNIPGVKVFLNNWDSSSQRIIPNKKNEDYNNSIEFNSSIDQVYYNIKEVWRKYFLLKKLLTKEAVVQSIEGREEVFNYELEQKSIIEYFDKFINLNKNIRAEQTIKGYVTCRNSINDFIKATNKSLFFEDINLEFFDLYRDFCFQEKKYLNSTFAKSISIFKVFLNWAADRDYHSNFSYHKFKASSDEIEVICLTLDELMKFFHYDFEKNKHSRVRDIYCFSAFTGLRYSDLVKLNTANIYENELKITVKKTKEQDLIIPLSKHAKTILKKYKGTIVEPLPLISSQKLNKYLKEACKIIELNNTIQIIRYSGNKRIEKNQYKYELITIHTARKTFVTNSLMLGMDRDVVKSITGHKSDSSFRKYLKISDEYKHREIKLWNNYD